MTNTSIDRQANVVAHFRVKAGVCSQVTSRLLGFFAQRDLVPSVVIARRTEESLVVRLSQVGLSEESATIIAEKMRSLVMVEAVDLKCRITRSRDRI